MHPIQRYTLWALISFLGVLCLTACGPKMESAETPNQLATELDKFTSWNRVAGYGVAVFGPNKVYFEGGYGAADIEDDTPYTVATTQSVASISKTVIAIALMQSQEMGVLSLDDPVNDYLDFNLINPHDPAVAITLRHLATHTSGLKYSEIITDQLAAEHHDMPLSSFLRSYLSTEGEWYSEDNFHTVKLGTLGDYSNIGASLAAHIIEIATGISFEDFTHQKIFEPLGMSQTHWYRTGRALPDSHHYTIEEKGVFEKANLMPDALYPSGTLLTSVKDLTALCQMVMRGGEYGGVRILKVSSVEDMLTFKKFKSLDDEIHRQGIFWYQTKDQLGVKPIMFGHNGGHNGAFTMMFIDPKTKRGLIMLGNTNLDDENNHVAYFNIYKSMWLFSRNTKS